MSLLQRILPIAYRLARRVGLSRWLKLLNVTMTLQVDGRSIRVPVRAGQNAFLLDPQPAWAEALYRRILPDCHGIFLDVGANFGQSLFLFLKHAHPGLRYIGIDPIPECAAYVRLLAERNALPEADVICAGLGSTEGLAVLRCVEISGSDSAMSSLESSLCGDDFYRSRLVVPVTTGDQLLQSLRVDRGVAFIKIDVEGYEGEVLKGLSGTISSQRPIVLSEVMFSNHPDPDQRRLRRDQVAETNRFFKSLDYVIYHAGHDGKLAPLTNLPEKDGALSSLQKGFLS